MKEIVKVMLQEGIDEETIHEALYIIEARRSNPLNSISKLFTGKTIEQHARNFVKKGVKKVANYVGDKINKSAPIKNTIGKDKLKKAQQDLLDASINYNYAKTGKRVAKDDTYKRALYSDEAKRYKKEVNKSAKEVNNIKKKYGFGPND